MKALKIADVKAFMAKLLIKETFDEFLASEVVIQTFNRFEINGKLNREHYSTEELELLGNRQYAKWSELKPFAFSVVKGNKTPQSFHISLMLSNESIEIVLKNAGVPMKLEEISGLYFHIKYENNTLYVITGTGIKTFTLDKSLENAWDEQAERFLKRNEIAYEVE